MQFVAGNAANKLLTFNGWRRSNHHKSELAATWRQLRAWMTYMFRKHRQHMQIDQWTQWSSHVYARAQMTDHLRRPAWRQFDSSLNAPVLRWATSLRIRDVSDLCARTLLTSRSRQCGRSLIRRLISGWLFFFLSWNSSASFASAVNLRSDYHSFCQTCLSVCLCAIFHTDFWGRRSERPTCGFHRLFLPSRAP